MNVFCFRNFPSEIFFIGKYFSFFSSIALYFQPLCLSDHAFLILSSNYHSTSFCNLFYSFHLVASSSRIGYSIISRFFLLNQTIKLTSDLFIYIFLTSISHILKFHAIKKLKDNRYISVKYILFLWLANTRIHVHRPDVFIAMLLKIKIYISMNF